MSRKGIVLVAVSNALVSNVVSADRSVSFHVGVDAGFIAQKDVKCRKLHPNNEDLKKGMQVALENWRLAHDIASQVVSRANAYQTHEVRHGRAGLHIRNFNTGERNRQFRMLRDGLNNLERELRPRIDAIADGNTGLVEEREMREAEVVVRQSIEQLRQVSGNGQIQWFIRNINYGQGGQPDVNGLCRRANDVAIPGGEEYLANLEKSRHLREKRTPVQQSGIVEGNFGFTYQRGNGVLGAELLVGANLKKTKNSKDSVYVAGIVRLGAVIKNSLEIYALGGLRLNKISPVVGAGTRIYVNPTKFLKLECNFHAGRLPRSQIFKIGFGCKL